MALRELLDAINVAAGTQGLEFNGACNAYAGTTGLEGQAALNVAAGTQGLEIQHVLNVLAGTTGLEAQAAANLIPSYTQGFEVSTSGWFITGGTLTRSTAQKHTGAASALITPDGVSATVSAAVVGSQAKAVLVGTNYNLSVWLYAPTALANVTIRLEWLTSAKTFLSADTTIAATVPAATWTRYQLPATAPASAAFVVCAVRVTGTPLASSLLYFDDVLLETP